MKKPPPIAGISDGLRCVGMIQACALPTRNRLAFLTLDSVLEISVRVFLKHKRKITMDPIRHRRRDVLMSMAKKNLKVDDSVWDHVMYCYTDIRCPLYHEASDMTVTDAMFEDYLETVAYLIKEMFAVDADVFVAEGRQYPGSAPITDHAEVDPNTLAKVDAIVLSLGMEPQKESGAILDHLRSIGFTGKLTTNAISAYLSQGKYFYRDRASDVWRLTDLVGRKRFAEITEAKP